MSCRPCAKKDVVVRFDPRWDLGFRVSVFDLSQARSTPLRCLSCSFGRHLSKTTTNEAPAPELSESEAFKVQSKRFAEGFEAEASRSDAMRVGPTLSPLAFSSGSVLGFARLCLGAPRASVGDSKARSSKGFRHPLPPTTLGGTYAEVCTSACTA